MQAKGAGEGEHEELQPPRKRHDTSIALEVALVFSWPISENDTKKR